MSRPRAKDLFPATAPNMLPPNTHFMTRGSLQPALCVLGGKLELGTSHHSLPTPPFRPNPNRANGGSPYRKVY